MGKADFILVVPSLDPDDKLAGVVHSALDAGIDEIVLVDDGSRPEKHAIFTGLAALPGVTLLTHPQNRGKGAALKTAFDWILQNRPACGGVVTADGDGQHCTEDILACGQAMHQGEAAVILGCRDFSLAHVPPKSRYGNRLTSLVFRLFCGMRISDTQTGLRGIPREYLPLLRTAKGDRYEYETNMLLLMGEKGVPYREIKIETLYFDENSGSHFRPVRDSLRVYGLILKYVASSLASSLLDILLFFLFSQFVFTGGGRTDVFLCTALARVLSATANFALNRRVVFDSRAGVGRTLVRYVCLAVPVMLSSWLCVYFVSSVLRIGSGALRTLVKIPVDVFLFLLSFRIQRRWVFADNK